jgi:DNA mismatch repair protein MutS
MPAPQSEIPVYTPKTPLMAQYFSAREQHPGVLLLMRVGDFYEAYGPDAETIAGLLSITLTGRDDGGQRVAMAGVPYHAAERYVARLIRLGHRVAMMDQVEDPKLAKGLVKRRVTRVVSRGTVLEDSLLDAKSNNYLVAAVVGEPVAGLGVADVTTGEFLTTELEGSRRLDALLAEIVRLDPAEVLVPDTHPELAEAVRSACGATVTPLPAEALREGAGARRLLLEHFGVASLRGFGCEEYTAGVEAAAMVLSYVQTTHAAAAAQLTGLSTYSTHGFMALDAATRRNLELTSAMGEGGRSRTLLGVLDCTQTSAGGRLLRRWLDEPLLDIAAIVARQAAVEELAADEILRGDVRELLRSVNDIERLVSRATAGLATGRDLAGLRDTLRTLPALAAALHAAKSDRLSSVRAVLGAAQPVHDPLRVEDRPVRPEDLAGLERLLSAALIDDPPATLREGGVIREGYSHELDLLRAGAVDGRRWIAGLEADERERTGIATLKVGFNAVFGYYLEVGKAHLSKVPQHYIRKQTTAAGERYITPELKEQEAKVLGADERALALEQTLFGDLRRWVSECSAPLIRAARAAAELDALASLAEAAVRNRYVRPEVHEGFDLEIVAGRHPVVERLHSGTRFVPNDCRMSQEDARMHVLTGPNMSGKSTALRQTALIVLMAQTGGFVPADRARIGVVDRIFTRVGAHDELATGQSTFMVEMTETANILNNATSRSLVILDEIGRGTSTWDGLSIAWAVSEYLLQIGCKTLFATHYHHLNDLAGQHSAVRNFRVAVRESGDHVVFLHRLMEGGTDRSYGIQVARMAGVPPSVIERAREVLKGLERSGAATRDVLSGAETVEPGRKRLQLTLFEMDEHPVVEALRAVEPSTMTPIEALMKLEELTRMVRER